MTAKNRNRKAVDPIPRNVNEDRGDIEPPPGYTPPVMHQPVESVEDPAAPDVDTDVRCSNCGSSDVVLEVKDDPSASDAAYCAEHRPANR